MSEMLDEELIVTRISNGSMSRKKIVEYIIELQNTINKYNKQIDLDYVENNYVPKELYDKLKKKLQIEENTNKNLSKECQKYFDAGMDMQQEIAELKEICSDFDLKLKGLADLKKGQRTLEQYKEMLKDKDKDTLIEWLYNMSKQMCNLRDELIGDRMEQFDDYVIHLQDKYLKLLGE